MNGLKSAAVLIVFVAICLRMTWVPIYVDGTSMEPTLNSGQLAFAKKTWGSWELKRFDIVISVINGERLVKRIVGMPGEVVEMKRGQLYVNGIPLREPYTQGEGWNIRPAVIPPDKYLLIGDNRREDGSSIYFAAKNEILARWTSVDHGASLEAQRWPAAQGFISDGSRYTSRCDWSFRSRLRM